MPQGGSKMPSPVVAFVPLPGSSYSSVFSLGFWVGLAVGSGSGLSVRDAGVPPRSMAPRVSAFVVWVVGGIEVGMIFGSSFRFFVGGEGVLISATFCFEREVLENAVAMDVDSRHLLIAFWLCASSLSIHSTVQFRLLCLVIQSVSNGP